MAEGIGQSDAETLISAVETGDVDAGAAGGEPEIFSRHRRAHEQVEIRDYDFKRPERISKDQMRSLQTLHETFARNLGASLSGFMRTIVEVRVAHAEQMTYSEFIYSLPNPTSFNLVEAEGLEGQMCLELSPLIIYPVIDRLLGGSNSELFIPQRPMTMIETRLIKQILARATSSLTEAWASVTPITFSLGEMESNPHIVQIVPPNEVVVVLGFEIKMTNRAGTMSLCIPFNVIEPVIEDLSSQNWFAAGKNSDGLASRSAIVEQLSDAQLEVAGVLAETTITVNELKGLEVGDVIVTGKPASRPAVLTAAGVPKYLANIGQSKGQRAMRVVRQVEPGERL